MSQHLIDSSRRIYIVILSRRLGTHPPQLPYLWKTLVIINIIYGWIGIFLLRPTPQHQGLILMLLIPVRLIVFLSIVYPSFSGTHKLSAW